MAITPVLPGVFPTEIRNPIEPFAFEIVAPVPNPLEMVGAVDDITSLLLTDTVEDADSVVKLPAAGVVAPMAGGLAK